MDAKSIFILQAEGILSTPLENVSTAITVNHSSTEHIENFLDQIKVFFGNTMNVVCFNTECLGDENDWVGQKACIQSLVECI